MRRALLGVLLVSSAVGATPLRRGASERWEGPVAADGTIFVRGMSGRIDVVAGTGDRARVVATPRGDGDPADVELVVLSHGGSITICTVWTRLHGRCEPGRLTHSGSGDGNDRHVEVNLRVEVPPGRALDASTLNGPVCVGGTTGRVKVETTNGDVTVRVERGDVDAHTTNGRVDAWSATGSVTAGTTSGDVDARMGRVPAGGDLTYETINGSVVLALPSDANVQIDAATVHGTVSGDLRSRPGGRRIRLRTVNGSVRVDRR